MTAAIPRVINVMIVQPDIPAYRVALFSALAACRQFRLSVYASAGTRSGPPSTSPNVAWLSSRPKCFDLMQGKILWQSGLRLPTDFVSGDVLVVAGNPRYLSNFPLLLEARRRGIGIIWWGHGWSATSVTWRAFLRRQLMRFADVLLLYADEEARFIAATLGSSIRVTATNNTLDPSAMMLAQKAWVGAKLMEFQRKQGIDSKKMILFCGRLRQQPSCGLECVLRALALAQKSGKTYLLAVIGTGEAETKLVALAESLGVAESVTWLGAIYEEELLAPWFLSARCLVYPGSVGLSLMHAFCYGLPVITHDQKSLHFPEIHALRDGENGRLFIKDDIPSLAQAICALCEDDALQAKMAERALHTALSDWSFEKMVQRFVAAIEAASFATRSTKRKGAL